MRAWLQPSAHCACPASDPQDACSVDDAYRTPDELINGEESSTMRRQLTNGTAYRAVKVAYTPADLQNRLQSLGWQINVTQMPGPFFWGAGSLS